MTRPQARVGLLFFASLLLLTGLFARSFWLQGVNGSALASDAAGQQQEIIQVPGLRGEIKDRSGRPLAGSEPGVAVFATPYQVTDPAEQAEAVAGALGADPTGVLDSLTAEGGFSYVERKVDLVRAEAVARLGYEAIGQHPDTIRTRPQGSLAAQVVGAVSPEGDGLTGLESEYESVLRGVDGERRIVQDATQSPISFETIRDPRDGRSIQLTLDAAIQAEAERVMDEVGQANDPVNASMVVLDADDADVLAMANWPALDLENLEEADEESLRNITTSYTYEPGSTFKAFTVAAALEEGTVTPSSAFTLAPSYTLYDRTVEEAHPRGTVTLSVGEILAQSSNVGAITIGMGVGSRKFSNWIDRFGFGKPTGVEFPGEEQGIVPAYEDWSGTTMINLPIGQGLSVTPIQMASAYAALAGDGTLRRPRMVRSVAGREVPIDKGRQVISPGTAYEVRSMLEGVLGAGGTASEVEVPGYSAAGKTGTAQIAEGGGYSETRYVASFVGMAPVEDPEIVVAVMVNEPKYGNAGGQVAAPAFGQIAEFALPYLGVPTG
ncbi:MAG: peptidoglycan D,D-transpeptidase FtsI family protein [Solirubrobacterales bacterium]